MTVQRFNVLQRVDDKASVYRFDSFSRWSLVMSEDFSFTTRRAINVPTRSCCSCLVSTAHGVIKSFICFHTESYGEDRYQNHVRAKGYRQYLSHLKIRIIEVSRVMSWTRRLPWTRCNHHGYYGNVYSRTDWPWFLRSLVEMGCQDGGTPKTS